MYRYSPECHYVVSRGATNLQDFHALEVDLGVGGRDEGQDEDGQDERQNVKDVGRVGQPGDNVIKPFLIRQ
jgi:hypothetical protein